MCGVCYVTDDFICMHLLKPLQNSNHYACLIVLQKRKVRKMHIMKGDSGLGLRIVGGKGSKFGDMGIFVNKLEEGGAAFK